MYAQQKTGIYEDIMEHGRQIGKGAYGTVFQRQGIAIKMMNKQNIKNFGQMKYIEREIEILEEMKKNNKQLIQYIGYEEDKVNFYLKFQLYRSGNLKDIIFTQWLLIKEDPSIGVRLSLQCLFGLSNLHENRFVHRDFKPQNVMIEEKNGRLSVRVGDFGNARLCTKEMISTVGTNLYMAPEIFRLQYQEGQEDYDMKCDIWSLGITIAQIYMGTDVRMERKAPLRNPFWENINPNKPEQIHKYYNDVIINEGVCLPMRMPQFLRILVRKMLIPSPKERISFEGIYIELMLKIKQVHKYLQEDEKLQYQLQIGKYIGLEKEFEGQLIYTSRQSKKMKRLFEEVYKRFIDKINIHEQCQVTILQFLYLVINYIIKFKKELVQYKWDKEQIYHLIKKQEWTKMVSTHKQIQILLLQVNIFIKKDEYLNKKEGFKDYIMKFGNKIKKFIEKELSAYQNQIYRTIKECIYE